MLVLLFLTFRSVIEATRFFFSILNGIFRLNNGGGEEMPCNLLLMCAHFKKKKSGI